MVNLDVLRARATRAYELARLWRALRVVLVVAPLALLCGGLTGAHEPCVCLGAVALVLTIGFRWWSREGARGVTLGLVAGGLTATAGLVLAGLGRSCDPSRPVCAVICLAAGVASGAAIGALPGHGALPRARFVPAVSVGLAVGVMGCAWLGMYGVLAAALGMLVGHGAFVWRRHGARGA